jgi:hypothetical protein
MNAFDKKQKGPLTCEKRGSKFISELPQTQTSEKMLGSQNQRFSRPIDKQTSLNRGLNRPSFHVQAGIPQEGPGLGRDPHETLLCLPFKRASIQNMLQAKRNSEIKLRVVDRSEEKAKQMEADGAGWSGNDRGRECQSGNIVLRPRRKYEKEVLATGVGNEATQAEEEQARLGGRSSARNQRVIRTKPSLGRIQVRSRDNSKGSRECRLDDRTVSIDRNEIEEATVNRPADLRNQRESLNLVVKRNMSNSRSYLTNFGDKISKLNNKDKKRLEILINQVCMGKIDLKSVVPDVSKDETSYGSFITKPRVSSRTAIRHPVNRAPSCEQNDSDTEQSQLDKRLMERLRNYKRNLLEIIVGSGGEKE